MATKAFPSAYGFGKFATGGREGKVIFVNTLSDTVTSQMDTDGAGSLRWALTRNYDRIIIPIVSGWVNLTERINIFPSMSDFTYLGMFAPGKGLGVRYRSVRCSGATNFIFRYLKVRKGTEGNVDDAFQAINGCQNFILDHCTISWGWDETMSTYTSEVSDYTVQNTIIAEGCDELAPEGGENGGERHAFGSIFGGSSCSSIGNIFAHFRIRNPSFSTSSQVIDFRNNVVYNWYVRPTDGGQLCQINMVNNYAKPGPASVLYGSDDIFCRPQQTGGVYGLYYFSGNVLSTNPSVLSNQLLGVRVDSGDDKNDVNNGSEFSIPANLNEDYIVSGADAYTRALQSCGMSLDRDSADVRLINEITSGTVTYTGTAGIPGIIDNPATVGGWPIIEELTLNDLGTSGDGIPDAWKIANGLNVNTNYGIAGTIITNPELYDTDTESPTYEYRWIEIYSFSLADETPTPPTEYTLTVQATVGGTVSNSSGSYEESESIPLIATASDGYVFVRWRNVANNSSVSFVPNFTFEMPSENVTLEAVFILSTPPIEGNLAPFRTP